MNLSLCSVVEMCKTANPFTLKIFSTIFISISMFSLNRSSQNYSTVLSRSFQIRNSCYFPSIRLPARPPGIRMFSISILLCNVPTNDVQIITTSSTFLTYFAMKYSSDLRETVSRKQITTPKKLEDRSWHDAWLQLPHCSSSPSANPPQNIRTHSFESYRPDKSTSGTDK